MSLPTYYHKNTCSVINGKEYCDCGAYKPTDPLGFHHNIKDSGKGQEEFSGTIGVKCSTRTPETKVVDALPSSPPVKPEEWEITPTEKVLFTKKDTTEFHQAAAVIKDSTGLKSCIEPDFRIYFSDDIGIHYRCEKCEKKCEKLETWKEIEKNKKEEIEKLANKIAKEEGIL